MTTAFKARHNHRLRHESGAMNKTEQAYAEFLELRLRGGEISGYEFECFKFRLAKKTFYTPDFVVYRPDGEMEIHEVKGHWEDDARVKIKLFADRYPFNTYAIQRRRGQWITEHIKP